MLNSSGVGSHSVKLRVSRWTVNLYEGTYLLFRLISEQLMVLAAEVVVLLSEVELCLRNVRRILLS